MSNLNLGTVKTDNTKPENSPQNLKTHSNAFYIFGILEIIAGIFLGLVLDNFVIWLAIGVTSGIFLFALAEIVRLLTIIAYKIDSK